LAASNQRRDAGQTDDRAAMASSGLPIRLVVPIRGADARAAAVGIKTLVGNHTFRATGITAYLKNGGVLENAVPWRTLPPRPPSGSMIGGEMILRSLRWKGLCFSERAQRQFLQMTAACRSQLQTACDGEREAVACHATDSGPIETSPESELQF
jgi:hypothetical protein